MKQISLFDVESVYAMAEKPLTNQAVYQRIAQKIGISRAELEKTDPCGDKGGKASHIKRRIRWHQQTLKAAGILEHADGQKGVWRLTKSAKTELHENLGRVSLVAYSTDLGAAIWGLCNPTFKGLDAPITLCLTSPPYLLRRGRAYGNVQTESAYIDFICSSLEPVVENLRDGGSICLNISNDCFLPGSPARSLYREKLVIALNERLGLFKMDELIWENPNKAPGPVQWASIERKQLNVGWEPIYWFTNNPEAVLSDNNRVLQPHSESHMKFLCSSHRPEASYSDGAYTKRSNSFRNITEGKIPRNILRFSSNCSSQRQYKQAARSVGLPVHGAPMPLALAKFLIEYLTAKEDLVVDIFAGSGTTGLAAEQSGRRWLMCDGMYEYGAGSMLRFTDYPGFYCNPGFLQAVA